MTDQSILEEAFGSGGRRRDVEDLLPNGWRKTSIKFVLNDLVAGGTPQTSREEFWAEQGEGTPWVKISDMTGVDEVDNASEQVTEAGINEANLRVHPPGTLLFSMYASLGATATLNISATTNQAILALYPDESVCIGEYLQYYLKAIRPFLPALSMSNTQDNLSAEKFGNLPLLLPPKEVQLNICNHLSPKLSESSEIHNNLSQIAENLRSRIDVVIRSAVTGSGEKPSHVGWIGEVPEHWDVVRTRFVAELHSGHTPDRSNDEYWEDTDIPWITTSDIKPFREGRKRYLHETENQISELGMENSGAHLLPEGTVFLSRTASVGFSGIMGESMATSQDFANWVCGDELIPEYLLYVFRSMDQEFNRLMQGSTHKTIYMPDIKSFKTPLPPLEEQREIVDHIETETERLWKLIDRVEETIDLLEEKRQALITAAVTGQIDVSDVKNEAKASHT
jgi:restriction endonuclease S subunit